MGDLTKNISRHELVCQCLDCNVRIQDHEPIIQEWQGACDYFAKKWQVGKVRLEITSPARCYVHNRTDDVGSNDESQHPRCCAIDGKIFARGEQIPPKMVYDYFDNAYPDFGGVGLYDSFTHRDTRAIKVRWGT